MKRKFLSVFLLLALLLGIASSGARVSPVFASKHTSTVVGWGMSGYLQTSVPAGLSDINAISGGVGDGQPTFPFSYYATQIEAGYIHTCFLTTAGGVKCWGYNQFGQLGDGTTTHRITPVDVSGLESGVSAIAAGRYHTCALTTAGGVKCWGQNSYGQLGDGTTTQRTTPVDVSGLAIGVSAIATGDSHTCALTTAGGVKCWGNNTYGQLGDGTTMQRITPVDVSGLTGNVSAIATRWNYTCALTSVGGLKCWGWNSTGQLGDGTTTQRNTPVDVSGLESGVSGIATGNSHTCALTTAGGVKCWGWNGAGQLGDGTTTQRTTPVDVSGLAIGVSAIATGDSHTCALTTAGSLKCWGSNAKGQLGDGTITQRNTPVNVSGLASDMSAIVAGGLHTCALTDAGGVQCWGDNTYGQLGDGTTNNRHTPTDVSGLTGGVSSIVAGEYHTCALTTAGGVQCWGRNTNGQLGDGTTTDKHTPVDVSGLESGVSAIVVGNHHSCALTDSGGLKCWGLNTSGQLGDGTTTNRTTPVEVSGLTSGVSAIAAGTTHTCALTTTGGLKCWGNNSLGQLGDGTYTAKHTPVDVSGLASGAIAIEAGYSHSCALTTVGGVKCWGWNASGQLGDGTTTNRNTPVDVSGLGSGVSAITAGTYHTCALTTAGGLKCWGQNTSGQLGDGTTTARHTPVDVSGLASGVSAIAAGNYHTCALTTAGGLKCWGNNSQYQLGDGTNTQRTTPADVSGLASGVSANAAGYTHTCALTTAGGLKCWGNNIYGQLGDGTTIDRHTPSPVSGILSSPFTRLALSLSPAPFGQELHFTATLSSAVDLPTGSVQFTIDGANFGSPALLSEGVAISADKSDLAVGAHLIQAFYLGDDNTFPGSSAGVVQAIIPVPNYTVTYDGNGNDGGSVPTDSNNYSSGATVTVLGNTGLLVKTGYTFAGWNTAANGSGTSYSAGNTFSMAAENVTLYALWAVNSQPTDIDLSASAVAEKKPAGTLVGSLSTTDPDAGDTFTYSFTCATPGSDDASFSIVGNSLNTAAIFDYETKNSYAICIRTTDSDDLFFDKNFTIAVTDVNEQTAKNGGFNRYRTAKANIPTFWVKNAKVLATDGKDTSVKREGRASVRFSGNGKSKTLTQTLTMSGPMGDTFNFSYWVKASNLSATGLCKAQVKFYDGTTLKGTKTVKCPRGKTYNWKRVRVNFTAPAAYTKVVIKFTFSKARGTVWFDLASLLR